MKIYHTKSGKSQEAINNVIEKFKAGDIGDITHSLKFTVPSVFPSSKYSYRNKMMCYLQGDSIVNGTFNFWKSKGRMVKKGSKAVYIFAPMKSKREDDDGEEYFFVYGYRLIPVFKIEDTEPIPDFDGEVLQLPELEPKELPPLVDVAEKLGLDVNWKPVPQDRWADFYAKGRRINMGTDSPAIFFHELCHALHKEVDNKFNEKEKWYKETVAEFGAAVLMDMYLNADHTGNSWEYIKMFADDPTEAVERSLMMIQRMFNKLEELTKENKNEEN